jgi:hypothetical protein
MNGRNADSQIHKCLDWQYSQFINIVGKDDRAGRDSSEYYGRTRSYTFGFSGGVEQAAPPPTVLPSHPTISCIHASSLLLGSSPLSRLGLSLIPCSPLYSLGDRACVVVQYWPKDSKVERRIQYKSKDRTDRTKGPEGWKIRGAERLENWEWEDKATGGERQREIG